MIKTARASKLNTHTHTPHTHTHARTHKCAHNEGGDEGANAGGHHAGTQALRPHLRRVQLRRVQEHYIESTGGDHLADHHQRYG